VSAAFFDVFFANEESIKFLSVFATFSHLDSWVDQSGIDFKHSDAKTVVISVRHLDSIETKLPDGTLIAIVFSQTGPGRTMGKSEVSVKQTAHMKFALEGEHPLDDYLPLIQQFRHFLSLAVGFPVYPTSYEATSESNRLELQGGEAYHPAVQVLMSNIDLSRKDMEILPVQMVLPFREIHLKFSKIMQNWFSMSDSLRAVYVNYFSGRYNQFLYLENRFLSIVQSIESYHRLRIGGTKLEPKQYEVMIKDLLSKASAEQADWISDLSRYGNEKSLRQRLKDIIRIHDSLCKTLIGTAVNDFINGVVDTRNYFTHYDADKKQYAATGNELLKISKTLALLVEACMIADIGFTVEEARELVLSRRSRYGL
jgi:hypothetical protein